MVIRRIPLPALFVLLTLIMGTLSMGQEQPSDQLNETAASDLIRSRCTSCHGQALTLEFSRRILYSHGPTALDELLAHHNAPNAEERDAIVEFLSQHLIETEQ